MRHVFIRGIMAIVWLAAAFVSVLSRGTKTAVLYLLLCAVFSYSAYATWKKEREERGE